MATTLEKCLLASVKSAQKQYRDMTGGYALWHAPESFVQMVVARNVNKQLGVLVYPECTPDGFSRDANRARRPGRPPKINTQQRFDLVIWWKGDSQPRALVELKLTYATMDSVIQDARKLIAFRKEAARIEGLRHGYLLVYNSAYRNENVKKIRQGKLTIEERFSATTAKLKLLGFHFVHHRISKDKLFFPSDEKLFAYGIAVWRIDF